MPTFTGTAGNNSWQIVDPGTFTIDGLGGVDFVDLGTSLMSSYEITLDGDGSIKVDSVSAASGAASELHLTVRNMELLYFDSKRQVLDLRAQFGDITPPSVTIADDMAGTALGNVVYSLLFSEAVTAPAASDFSVANGSVLSVSGSGSSYQVVVAPSAGTEGTLGFSLKSAAVADSSGNVNAEAHAAAQPIDTLAPMAIGFSPAAQAAAVAPDSNIVVSFSEPVQKGTGGIWLRNGAGVLVASYGASSAELSVSGAVLTIDPGAPLEFGTTYTLEFDAGTVIDAVGNGWIGSAGQVFTTAVDPANPMLTGSLGNDRFVAGNGALTVDGLAGLDTVSFAQQRASYTVESAASGFSVVTIEPSASTTLSHVERLAFSDNKLALDLDANAGRVAKILGAVFGPASVGNQEYVGIGLQLLDGGMSYEALVQLALNAAIGAGASHSAVVNLLYTNVVGAAPSAGELAELVNLLDQQIFTTATLGVFAADHELNRAHIDLVGLALTGIAYIGG